MPQLRAVFLLMIAGLFVWGGWSFFSPGVVGNAPLQAYMPPATDQPISPIPTRLELDPRKVALGRRLFHETRLSRDNSISCASCHVLKLAGVDARALAVGIDGRLNTVNTPTVLNSGFNFSQFWDGRAVSLEDQVAGPLHNPVEMDTNWRQVIAKLEGVADYRRDFAAIWPGGITAGHIQSALAEFERSLITPDAPFDHYLRGDSLALSAQAREGWELFRKLGCIACHQGVNVGGNMYANLGVMGDFFADRGKPLLQSDLGRFNVTGLEEDRHMFKVPSLRNVERTAPYFHDGSITSLGDAVDTMARYQLGCGWRRRSARHCWPSSTV
ncbi:MAG: cytochrome c peroxidase [Pseudomonadota bacterium]|nr:cytochrome c peroxidase [Pseudomonadota bacterium]MDP1905603.1 cytochrome c peroxidase [Pseudomonadota bacterium]MDP2351632.1 cytochrome c peroxidase [Pseudomonadota bacterium]